MIQIRHLLIGNPDLKQTASLAWPSGLFLWYSPYPLCRNLGGYIERNQLYLGKQRQPPVKYLSARTSQ